MLTLSQDQGLEEILDEDKVASADQKQDNDGPRRSPTAAEIDEKGTTLTSNNLEQPPSDNPANTDTAHRSSDFPAREAAAADDDDDDEFISEALKYKQLLEKIDILLTRLELDA